MPQNRSFAGTAVSISESQQVYVSFDLACVSRIQLPTRIFTSFTPFNTLRTPAFLLYNNGERYGLRQLVFVSLWYVSCI